MDEAQLFARTEITGEGDAVLTIGDDTISEGGGKDRTSRPPAFNVPGAVLALIIAMIAVHALRSMILGDIADTRLIIDFAFIPGCYGEPCGLILDRAAGASLWSPISHAFLHGDWTHLGLNTVWLLAFGSPVARRLGVARFLMFCAAGAGAGALTFYALNPSLIEPVIGASGVVSALMGGACRFAFAGLGARTPNPSIGPRLSIAAALSNRTILFFIVVFFATNLVTFAAGGFLAGSAQIAWEAHIGGFAFGFFCFGLFDPRRDADAPPFSQSP